MTHASDLGLTMTPSCSPLRRLSYSEWSRVTSCGWKAAFARDDRSRSLSRGSVPSAMGNARHAIEEEVAGGLSAGRPYPSRAWVEGRFQFLLQHESGKLQAAWAPAQVPEVRTWPQVTRVKMALSRRLGVANGTDDVEWPAIDSLIHSPTHRFVRGSEVPGAPDLSDGEFLSEVWLVDTDRQMAGQMDRLSRDAGRLCVTEFKSGIGLEVEELAARHTSQLLFYASIVEHAYGEWPRLTIDGVAAPMFAVSYSPDAVVQLREAVDTSRQSFNQSLSEGGFTVSAAASESPCCWCPYQVVCPVFTNEWTQINDSVVHTSKRSLTFAAGRVTAISKTVSGLEVRIVQEQEFTAPAGDVTLTRLPELLEVSVGDAIAVSGLEASGSTVLRTEWNSVIRVEPMDAA